MTNGKSLFSFGSKKVLPIIENDNGDICVADYYGKAVVVVNQAGEFRFKYQGNMSFKLTFESFNPGGIITNVNKQILITDDSMEIVHVIDRDGNFLRYIEYPSKGGLSIDADHNLVFGEEDTGKIRIIKYLE